MGQPFLCAPFWRRNGVNSGGTEGTTAGETSNGEPQPAARTVGFNGFNGVVRARRPEPARGWASLTSFLIKANRLQHGLLCFCEILMCVGVGAMVCGGHGFTSPEHFTRSRSRCWPNSANDAVAARGEAPNTYTPGAMADSRVFTSSRNWRRSLFRRTADPYERPRA